LARKAPQAEGGDAHDKGAAAQCIALADGGDPQQQAGTEQCAAAGGARQLGSGRRRFTQPGEGEQQQGGQQEAATNKGGGGQFADRLFREEPAGSGQQGDQYHQQQGSAVHRGRHGEMEGKA